MTKKQQKDKSIELADVLTTNWFGLSIHPTDEYIHWKDRDFIKHAAELRAAYDAIVAAGLEEQLKVLLRASYNMGSQDEAESNAGASL